jgi:hypothetical protein
MDGFSAHQRRRVSSKSGALAQIIGTLLPVEPLRWRVGWLVLAWTLVIGTPLHGLCSRRTQRVHPRAA